ncbi:MAG: hypothetical protein WA783_15330 [Phormidesmis sp.]
MTLVKWFQARRVITFQENILSQKVQFPRLSVYQHIRQSEGEVYGFSVTVEQLRHVQGLVDPNQFLQDLRRGGCRVIYLRRRGALRQAIAVLKTYNIHDQQDEKNHPSRPSHHRSTNSSTNKLTINVSELLACLQYLDHQRLEASAILHDIPYLDLVYEDDLMDPNAYPQTAQKLSTFLEDLDIIPVGSPIKLVHHQLADIINNYAEVCEAIENSEYAYLLTDSRDLMTL